MKITYIKKYFAAIFAVAALIGVYPVMNAVGEIPGKDESYYVGDSNATIMTNGDYNDYEIHHVVTDPLGRRLGYNPLIKDGWYEIDGVYTGHMSSCEGEDCPEGDEPPQTRESMFNLVDGTYVVEVIAQENVKFVMSLYLASDKKGQGYNVYGYVDKNVPYKVKFTFDSGAAEPFTVTRMATFETLKRDIRLGHELLPHSIDNEGIMKSLLKKAEAAEDAANRGQYKTAVNQLNALLNEVKAQARVGEDKKNFNKHIAPGASVILTEDAEYLIKELEAK